MTLHLDYKGENVILTEHTEDTPFLSYRLLDSLGLVRHGVSTRLGGVSEGVTATMNLSFTRGDDPDRVMENYRRMARSLGTTVERMVCSHQTHTTNVRVVTKEDCGKGILKEKDYENVDGLVTNVPGVCLVTLYADCVPLLFVDPVHKAIGTSHSGWRGTVGRMGQATLDVMRREFGTDPEKVYAAIGPSICQDCYEVSEDVIDAFQATFPKEQWDELFYPTIPGKYQLDLWRANERILLDAGIPKEQIAVTNLCTCCNSQQMFSHRASGGKRGNLAVFMELL